MNPWRHGRYAKAVTSDEVYERRFSEIEAGKIGSDQDREQIRRLQRELEHCERCDRHYLETEEVRAELRDLVMALGKTKT